VTAIGQPLAVASPADRRLRIAIAVVALIGVGIAGYLTYVHYAGLKVVCLSSGGCETVQASRWSKLDGVPVAVLGLAGYVAILGSLALRGELGRSAGFGIALIGFLFSCYLTYREVFTIKAICQWCVGSAVLMTILVGLTAARVIRDDGSPPLLDEPFADDPEAEAEPVAEPRAHSGWQPVPRQRGGRRRSRAR
jgi:uncharacterized membrane protein